ncbi:phosphopantetheine-binding protein, partial [Actinosynnema sp. NPDC023658]|uniref:phosphopantetheine-binding protein n=1 Tax=Actinosynnema sp. NPDC023658 TaxID=3155465 RepID=UPI0033FCB0EA
AHPQSGQRQLAAYLVVDRPEDADPAVLRAALSDQLPGYMVPNHYVTVDAVPLTANGKVDHTALPAPWRDAAEPEARLAPRGDVERKLLKLWSEQLGHTDFGVEDGFFEVGGDSLHAVGIIGALRSEFGIDAAAEQEIIEALFSNANVADFARVIEAVRDAKP